MKQKIISFLSIGIVGVIVVMISDLIALLNIGTFAWVAFMLWNFTSKEECSLNKLKQLFRILLGLPIGLALAICMIHGPKFFGNNIIVKYLIIFLCNGIATLFPGNMIPGIFFGIGLTFSGLGVGLSPDSIENTLLILVIMIIFSTIGICAAWATEKIQTLTNK